MAGEPAAEDPVVGEPRWHMASAVIAAIVLIILMPDDLRLGPNWLLPVIVGVLLAALIAGDPGRIDRRTAMLRAPLRRADLRARLRRTVGDGPTDVTSDQRRQGD